MNPTQTPATPLFKRISILLEPPHIYGVASLCLIALGSFLFAGTLVPLVEPADQTASAANSITAYETVQIRGKSAIVVDLVTGKVLYQKDPDAQLALASLTKVPLVLAISEVLDPKKKMTIPYDTAPTGSGGNRLKAGQVWDVQDVINFTLIASSNEGAQILADEAASAMRAKYPEAPAEDPVLWRMNDLAYDLGLTNTYFLNVSGLDESETQSGAYGTARSVATIMAYAAQRPDPFFGTAIDGLLMADEAGNLTSAINTNEALGSIPGLILGKTGYTDLAGGNLAVVFDVGLAHPVVAVVMGSTRAERFADMKKLVEAAHSAVAQQ